MLVIIEGLLKRRVLHAACYIFDDGWRPPVAPPRAQGPGSRVHSQCSVVHVRPRALSFISPSHKQESCVARFHTCAKIKDKHTLKYCFYECSLSSFSQPVLANVLHKRRWRFWASNPWSRALSCSTALLPLVPRPTTQVR